MLESEQEELLSSMIEAERDVPRPERQWHLARNDAVDMLQGPSGLQQVLATDIYAFEEAGLIRVTGRYTYGLDFILAPAAQEYYRAMKQGQGEPLQRQEAELRRLLDSQAFRSAYPSAYARWSEAEGLLWGAQSKREFTTVGHKCREAMQDFATEVVRRYEPQDVDTDPAKVNRRLGAVIAELLPTLGDARAALLKALGNYSEATMDCIQRQEHGGQKEGHALTWMDARRVVFHAAAVMYEFAVSFEEAEPEHPRHATLEAN